MKGLSIGFCLVLAMAVFGYTLGGGDLSRLVYGPAILAIFSFIAGSLVLGFGVVKPMQMISDAFRAPSDGYAGNLVTNALICECASRAALFGAAVSGLAGFVNAYLKLGGDISLIAPTLMGGAVAPVLGALISAFVFRPLKQRFLTLQKQRILRRDPMPAKAVITDFLLVTAAVVISIVVLVAYLLKTVTYLERVLR
ncbi:MAG: hypothetical protein HYY23_00360 [Verrucomicrobia bacterium]|nr:hypothetical protein [Verrucomicrobiota bacterium]